jgi:general secretion pathway protein A
VFESHFGFSAPPFQLNPDPTFYYGSKGHSNALAYLQYGVHQAEGFIVVTGEIGAGKTTLVRTLLEGLDGNKVRAAQIASTQLDATGLLQAMLAAFGVPPPAGAVSKATLISTLEAFFMTLAIKNKRALLVVDEAQNLSLDAIEELRMLSNFQLRKQALLQSFLVGQPELRGMLESQRLEQLRQRVIASCHLGPLGSDETRRYIEHRLKRVGWVDQPRFDDEAFATIHQATGGVPRRINLLCNRLLLSAYLENRSDINEAQVLRIAAELRAEVGEAASLPGATAGPRAAAQRALPVLDELALAPRVRPNADVHRVQRRELAPGGRTALLLVDSAATYLSACLLASALEQVGAVPRCVVVACGAAAQVGSAEHYAEVSDLPALELHLGIEHGSAARRTADTVLRFEAVLTEFAPEVVLAFGVSDEALACATLLSRVGSTPLLRVGVTAPVPQALPRERLHADLLNRLAHGAYANSTGARLALEHTGMPAEQVFAKGNLTLDAVAEAHQVGSLAQALISQHGLASPFVLVTARVGAGRLRADALPALVALLARTRAQWPMLWLACGETLSALRAQGLMAELSRAGVAVASLPVFSSRLSLLHRAGCLLTDGACDLIEVALALDAQVLRLAPVGATPLADEGTGRVSDLPLDAQALPLPADLACAVLPEGRAAPAIAEHLRTWLAQHMAV